ncbi:hypothetical protein BDN72DRAFT_791667 [Pluteus cervinus]|uniref:Uncharacterized protein n=1 Tax=Pluteus cervinus TaxID=181527 RepID=A0ACD3B4J1_9AGAR|nr:hypothetical protein BDN72DRAFT_791667 [Pluteus cervinus]
MSRPPLPVRHANPSIQSTLTSGALPVVKYQVLSCQGQEILVGRLKIETPTPSGHAFILRRFDTGAISLTTMFRAAFPLAAEHEEKQEVQWVKDNHDLTGNNGTTKDTHITRLAGVWVGTKLALELGKAYALGDLINIVVDAKPDPNANYRRSGRNGSNAPPSTVPAKPTTTASPKPPSSTQGPPKSSLPRPPSPAITTPHPAKRRREHSPAATPVAPPSSSPAKSTSPLKLVPPRRSTRVRSPAPKVIAAAATARTPRGSRVTKKEDTLVAAGSDATAVEDDGDIIEEVAGSQLHEQDIEEQKKLIEDLKAARQNALRHDDDEEDEGHDDMAVDMTAPQAKRTREEADEPLQFNFREPETSERAIVTNSRVNRFRLEPRTRSFAWGVLAFSVGLGAVSLLPSFL